MLLWRINVYIFSSKVIDGARTHIHTHGTDCFIWATKFADRYSTGENGRNQSNRCRGRATIPGEIRLTGHASRIVHRLEFTTHRLWISVDCSGGCYFRLPSCTGMHFRSRSRPFPDSTIPGPVRYLYISTFLHHTKSTVVILMTCM